MRVIFILIGTLAAFAVSLAGCDDDGSDEPGRTTIVASTGVLAEIVAGVAGEDAAVTQLIPDSVSPHEFQLSAADRFELEQADLVVLNGAGLEASIPVEEVEPPTWQLAEHAGQPRPGDPHVWMDPTRVVRALPSLASALAEADPASAGAYRDRAAAYEDRLLAVDRDLARRVAEVPVEDRKLVTSHDALGYFADRYGFEVIATTFPASGAEAEASAAKLRDVEEAVRAAGVPAVFAEAEDDPSVLEGVAEDTGVEIVTDLLVETPGPAGTYVEMLEHDGSLIIAALGG